MDDADSGFPIPTFQSENKRLLSKATPGERMKSVLHRLIEQGAPTLSKEAQDAKAVEVQLQLKSGLQMRGALSFSPDGTLRCLAPGSHQESQHGPVKRFLLEHFFNVEDVECVVVLHMLDQRPQVEGSRIILPRGSNGKV